VLHGNFSLRHAVACGMHKLELAHAARSYSCTNPPSRSRRITVIILRRYPRAAYLDPREWLTAPDQSDAGIRDDAQVGTRTNLRRIQTR
jgi:hypothetical protein